MDTANRNFKLRPGSPAIDKGTNLSPYLTVDIAGVPRPYGTGWDIGAYEYLPGGDTTPPAAPTASRYIKIFL